MSLRSTLLADLTSRARALAACPAVWAPLAVHSPDRRNHARLTVGHGWEAYLITWPSGHGVELHDHGGSAGAVAVLAGDLVEVVARQPAADPPAAAGVPPAAGASPTAVARRGTAPLARHRIGAGTVHPVPPGRVHDVVNTGRVPATSIHVYGPALETMTFYDDELRPVRTERIYPEPPMFGLDDVEDCHRRSAIPAG